MTEDLNQGLSEMRRTVAENALTLLRNNDRAIFPLMPRQFERVAYVGIGLKKDNAFSTRMRNDYGAHVYYFDYTMNETQAKAALEFIKGRYDVVVTGLHNYSRFPARIMALAVVPCIYYSNCRSKTVPSRLRSEILISLPDLCDPKVLVACYEDDSIVQETAMDLLQGKIQPKGKLPVTVCPELKVGTGITVIINFAGHRSFDGWLQ